MTGPCMYVWEQCTSLWTETGTLYFFSRVVLLNHEDKVNT